ncbi:3105_t:CDS:1 [Ambispora leptoticha]|uniref:3105_t:CDS:1 n=1 Tax=Ambispora leptoticha TaxID=144679 RepID=A0A9N8W8N6_9GLOM|nr:3105_t:CDS:1 [Ambispora leptoticha]
MPYYKLKKNLIEREDISLTIKCPESSHEYRFQFNNQLELRERQLMNKLLSSQNKIERVCSNSHEITKLLTELSQVCRNIQGITVRIKQEVKHKSNPDKDVDEIMDESKSLVKIVMTQKHLRTFDFSCYREPNLLPNLILNGLSGEKLELFEEWHTQRNCVLIMEALEAHAHSLEVLSFDGLNSLHWKELANLQKFNKLRELNFSNLSYRWNLSPLKLLYTSDLPNLQKLSFRNSQIYAHGILKIIETNSQHLTSLDLRIERKYWVPSYNIDKDYHLFFKHVGRVCPKLLHFSCFITFVKDLESILDLVKSCTKLQTLIIDKHDSWKARNCDLDAIDNFLSSITSLKSKNLNTFCFVIIPMEN